MNEIKYGPTELKGRDFMQGDEWAWVFVTFENKAFYCKVKADEIPDIANGASFQAFNMWVLDRDGKFVYVSAANMILEPMFIHKVSTISFVHYQVASDLDKMTKANLCPSNIIQVNKDIQPVEAKPFKLIEG